MFGLCFLMGFLLAYTYVAAQRVCFLWGDDVMAVMIWFSPMAPDLSMAG
jgi:hypothetical protein